MAEITARADFSHAPCSKGDRLARGCVAIVGRTANLPSYQAFRLYTFIRNIQERFPAASTAAYRQGPDAQKCGISPASLSAAGRKRRWWASALEHQNGGISAQNECNILGIVKNLKGDVPPSRESQRTVTNQILNACRNLTALQHGTKTRIDVGLGPFLAQRVLVVQPDIDNQWEWG